MREEPRHQSSHTDDPSQTFTLIESLRDEFRKICDLPEDQGDEEDGPSTYAKIIETLFDQLDNFYDTVVAFYKHDHRNDSDDTAYIHDWDKFKRIITQEYKEYRSKMARQAMQTRTSGGSLDATCG